MIYKRFIRHHTLRLNGCSIKPPVKSTLKKELEHENIEHLTIVGWPEKSSLDFLKDMNFIKSINIDLDGQIDISPINLLSNLEDFETGNRRIMGKIDFKNFPHLKYLNFFYSHKIFENFASLKNVEELTVNSWPFDDLNMMTHLKKLKVLRLDFPKKLKSLSGIEKFQHLDSLDIYSAPKLEDISDLKSNSKTIKRLSLELVNKVQSFHVLDELKEIERFYIYRSSPLHSVDFIKHINLTNAYIGTEVLDGNLEILIERKIKYLKLKKYTQK